MDIPEEVEILFVMKDNQNFWKDWSESQRQDAMEWMVANGINPNNVPINTEIVVLKLDAPAIRWSEYVRDAESGKILINRCSGTHLWNDDETVMDCHCRPRMVTKMTLMRASMPYSICARSKELM